MKVFHFLWSFDFFCGRVCNGKKQLGHREDGVKLAIYERRCTDTDLLPVVSLGGQKFPDAGRHTRAESDNYPKRNTRSGGT